MWFIDDFIVNHWSRIIIIVINFEENVLKAQRENVMEKIVAESMNKLMFDMKFVDVGKAK